MKPARYRELEKQAERRSGEVMFFLVLCGAPVPFEIFIALPENLRQFLYIVSIGVFLVAAWSAVSLLFIKAEMMYLTLVGRGPTDEEEDEE